MMQQGLITCIATFFSLIFLTDGHTYSFHETEKLDYSGARTFCSELTPPKHIIDIQDEVELQALKNYYGVNPNVTDSGVWVGAQRASPSGIWTWDSGYYDPSVLQNAGGNGNCALYDIMSILLTSASCTSSYGVICEDTCPDDDDKSSPGICGCGVPDDDDDDDGIYNCFENKYTFENTLFNYTEAADTCEGADAGLVRINSAVEEEQVYRFVTQTLSNLTLNHPPDHAVSLHIGLTDAVEEDSFLWSDGQPLSYQPYENWGSGQPDNQGDNGEDCGYIIYNKGFGSSVGDGSYWRDGECSFERISVCEDECPDSDKSAPGYCGCDTADIDENNNGVYDCNEAKWKIYSPRTFEDAVSICEDDDLAMIEIEDGAENAQIAAFVSSEGFSEFWIGLRASETPMLFEWVGTNYPVSFQSWAEGFPTTTTTDLTCVSPSANDGSWYDVECDLLLPIVCEDECPDNPDKGRPGICGCGTLDTDSDDDGTPDCNDNCPNSAFKTDPGICGCLVADVDSDGDGEVDDTDSDGTPDCNDGCPNDGLKTEPLVCGCGEPDTDTDDDGTPDCIDLCPDDPLKTEPMQCGCGIQGEGDEDEDGFLDCNDECPTNKDKIHPGICGCNQSDTDADEDGFPDCVDICDHDPKKQFPGTCGCGEEDRDRDHDGTPDCADQCPHDYSKTSVGQCGCGFDEVDTDGDGVMDCVDHCDLDEMKTSPGLCGCGVPDQDIDGDGFLDCDEQCPGDVSKTMEGECGCGIEETDSDHDGTKDCLDECPDDPDKSTPGICGCGKSDSDNNLDSIADCLECDPTSDVKYQCPRFHQCLCKRVIPTPAPTTSAPTMAPTMATSSYSSMAPTMVNRRLRASEPQHHGEHGRKLEMEAEPMMCMCTFVPEEVPYGLPVKDMYPN
jgi:hypothetical protein